MTQVQTPDPDLTDTGDYATVPEGQRLDHDEPRTDTANEDEFLVDFGHVPDGKPVTLSTAAADDTDPMAVADEQQETRQ